MQKLKLPENIENLNTRKQKLKNSNSKYFQSVKSDEEKLKKYRDRKKEHMRKSRLKKKLDQEQEIQTSLDTTPPQSTYSASALSKAVERAKSKLPRSEGKKKIVIQQMVKCLQVNAAPTDNSQPNKRPRKGFEVVEKAVIAFYECDIVSRQNPSVRDFIRQKDENGRFQRIQTFTLMYPIREVYQKFKEIFSEEHKIAISKFKALRPRHVIDYSHAKQETCLCSHCENIKLMAAAFIPYLLEKTSKSDFLKNLFCDDSNFQCASGDCIKCKDVASSIDTLLIPDCGESLVRYMRWEKSDFFYERKNVTGVTLDELILKFEPEFVAYRLHYFIQKEQKTILREKIEDLGQNEAIIICDFSERFTTQARREIQSSYFGKKQISLFTVKMYIGSVDFSYVIASDENSQSKFTVHAYLDRMIEIAKEMNPNLNFIKIYSDGCAGQFKNKFMMSNLLHAQNDFGVALEWNFFGTGHGKSPADGLGAIVKRGVHRKVLGDDSRVYTAAEFVSCASTFVKKIKVFEMTKEEIETRSNFLKNRWIRVPAINGIQKHHHFKVSENHGCLTASITSRGINQKEFKLF